MTIVIRSQFIPISANAAYRNATAKDHTKGRIRTKRYNEWKNAFAWDVKIAMRGQEPILGPYSIVISIDRKTRHKLSDVMNREKVMSDALQQIGVIKNDNLCESGTVRWADLDEGGVQVEVEAWQE